MTDTKRIGSNKKQVKIARLRGTALNDSESPVERIEAARKLLQDYGPSDRSLPIIREVIKLFVSDADADVAERAQKLRAKLAKRLEIKSVKLPPEIEELPIQIPTDVTDLDAIAGEPEVQKLSDEWDRPAPLSTEEAFRLLEVQRPFQTFVNGDFVLKPGVNTRAMIDAALNGRPFMIHVLKKLHSHMERSFNAGGVGLACGPLYVELGRILRNQGALPAIDPSQKTYGEKLMEELYARN
jgi:hypothetical protein